MTDADSRQQAQMDYWNNEGGARWIAVAERTDRMLAPVREALLAHADLKPGMDVLEIGCGCGAGAAMIADRIGGAGFVLGVDVSRPILARARERLSGVANAALEEADAAAYPFRQFADLVLSQFGVMFFGDPAAAFANIRQAIKRDGRLLFACWRTPQENEWMRVPLEAVLSGGIPPAPPPGPEEPGPFSFADANRVKRILSEAGFAGVEISPRSFSLDISGGGGLEEAIQQAMTIGAGAALLREQPEEVRAPARERIAKALRPYENGGTVSLAAEVWFVEAGLDG